MSLREIINAILCEYSRGINLVVGDLCKFYFQIRRHVMNDIEIWRIREFVYQAWNIL